MITEPITENEALVLVHTSNTGRYVTDEPQVIALAARGLLRDFGPQRCAGGMHYFTMTASGREALADWRARQPPPPKVKRRRKSREFECWQNYREVWKDIPFSQFHRDVWPEAKYRY